jgi:hypothetical protein
MGCNRAQIVTSSKEIEEVINTNLKNAHFPRIISDFKTHHLNNLVSVDMHSNFYHKFVDADPETFKKNYFETPDFFKRFGAVYPAQLTPSDYYANLELHKEHIFNLITAADTSKFAPEELQELYRCYFAKKPVDLPRRHMNFSYTSLLHVFYPERFTSVNNPVINYFKDITKNNTDINLNDFDFICWSRLLSQAYRNWAESNPNIIRRLRALFKENDPDGLIYNDKLTDIKVLDLIFWARTNTIKTKAAPKKKSLADPITTE